MGYNVSNGSYRVIHSSANSGSAIEETFFNVSDFNSDETPMFAVFGTGDYQLDIYQNRRNAQYLCPSNVPINLCKMSNTRNGTINGSASGLTVFTWISVIKDTYYATTSAGGNLQTNNAGGCLHFLQVGQQNNSQAGKF